MREQLVAALSRDYGVHPYGKWRGAFWRLLSLVDLGVPKGHRGALDAAEKSLAWLSNPQRLGRIHKRVLDGRVRRCASQDGRGLYVVGLTTVERAVGLADPRTADALDVLESRRRPDRTWRTEGRWWKRPGAGGSNFEAVDWGETADERLTEQAMHVLAAAGRLEAVGVG